MGNGMNRAAGASPRRSERSPPGRVRSNALEWLNRQRWTHFAINRLGMRRVANALLARVPIRRTLAGSGARYRCRYLDSIALAEEVFGRRIYGPAVPANLSTFVDLGCNVGFFEAFLVHVTGRRDLRGLAVDADADMVRETSWTLAANGLSSVHAVHGLVGGPSRGGEADFYLHPVTIKSSAYAVDEPGRPFTGSWRKTRVPIVEVERAWSDRFGDARCNLLKIDVEGAEADFITPDNAFLRRVDAIVVEVHKWVITPDVVDDRLATLGFDRTAQLVDSPTLSVATYGARR
jgi:FkbM family methyltransferase